jgi:putative GTP pyrophosphokinase
MITRDDLQRQYAERYKFLEIIAKNLTKTISDVLQDKKRIDRIIVRAKSIDRFIDKAFIMEKGERKYTDPINQIQDQIGARIITFYLFDVERIAQTIEKYFSPIEEKVIVPDSINEFGYEGRHFILFLPEDVLPVGVSKQAIPKFFELQIKTLFQHAWGEANHDLIYKPIENPDELDKRLVAFTAAQAWGADYLFNDVAEKTLLR